MIFENREASVETPTDTGEGEATAETISLSKVEYEKMNQTLGSLKRELKDLKKPKDEPKDTSTPNQTDDSALLQKLERMSLRQAGLTHPDDVELARATAKKWNVDIDEVLEDEDFKVKLERQQTTRDNAVATSNIKGGAGTSQAKFSPEYWLAKGVPPSASDVPDRKTRAKIVRSFIAKAGTNGKTFYNDYVEAVCPPGLLAPSIPLLWQLLTQSPTRQVSTTYFKTVSTTRQPGRKCAMSR